MPMSTHSADTVRSVICDAPLRASLPKALIVAMSMITSTAMGMSDNTADGLFFSSSPFLFLFSDIVGLFSCFSFCFFYAFSMFFQCFRFSSPCLVFFFSSFLFFMSQSFSFFPFSGALICSIHRQSAVSRVQNYNIFGFRANDFQHCCKQTAGH